MNGPATAGGRKWARLSASDWDRIEERVRRQVQVRDDFVQIPFPRLASAAGGNIAAAAVESYRREAAIVDPRLSREVTLAVKGMALADLCAQLHTDTGIRLTAGPSVADEKVTLFCQKMPLRDVMRQLARPFGYAWLRSPTDARRSTLDAQLPASDRSGSSVERQASSTEYRYELAQDLRSQLVEEELRNRDRNGALLALEREIARYRPYLALTPDEALTRAQVAPPGEKKLLEQLSRYGWGPLQMYHRLSSREMAALRSGRTVTFSTDPKPGEQPLPPDVARGVFQTMRDWRLFRRDDAYHITRPANAPADAMSPGSVEGVVATVRVSLRQSELGEFTLGGNSGFYTGGKRSPDIIINQGSGAVAAGRNPTAARPGAPTSGITAEDPALRRRVSLRPEPSCVLMPAWAASPTSGEAIAPRVTSADVLEAIHKASGMPVVGDYYTRFAPQRDVTVQDQPLARALDQVAEALRLRWAREGDWLQFRSATYYDDRLKEVPNRLLSRWAASRQQRGMLTLDDLIDIAQLSDAQLDAAEMAAGALVCYGLQEWNLARSRNLRAHLQYLASLTPAQRQEAAGPRGLAFTRMTLAQQQQFMELGLSAFDAPLQSLDELAGALVRVEYTQPGEFEWRPSGPGWFRWALPAGQGRRVPRPPARDRTPEGALQAARPIEAAYRPAMLRAAQRIDPGLDEAQWLQQSSQVVPTRLDLSILYFPGSSHDRVLRVATPSGANLWATWETSVARRQ